MKKFFLFAIIAAFFVACKPSGYKIEGKIGELTNTNIYLRKIVEGRPVAVDTTKAMNGQFTFTGKEDTTQLYLVYVEGQRIPVVFFCENANISITADDAAHLDKAVITGSPTTDIYTKFIEEIPETEHLQELNKEYQDAMKANEQETINDIKNEVNEAIKERTAYLVNFVKENTNNAVGANVAMQIVDQFELEDFKKLVSEFETNLGDHPYVKVLKQTVTQMESAKEAEKATEIGAIAPEFMLKTKDGKDVSLSSLKGNYLLVDFWASWCKPCRAENPNVVEAYNKYNGKGFDVLSVSLDRDPDAWKKAVDEDALTWTQVNDNTGDVANQYAIRSIPTNFLLDKDGKIVAKNLRGDDLEAKLKELLD